MSRRLVTIGVVLGVIALVAGSCSGARLRYTSQDLALLPCETGMAPRFFQPLEFTASGDIAYTGEQELKKRLTPSISDVVVFVHGWNKNPSLAERDYQDFICRMHAHIRDVAQQKGLWRETEKGERLLVLGIFWPSTLQPNSPDSIIAKLPSYFQMRERADQIAETGLQNVLSQVAESASHQTNLYLVGHSFGGRMLVRALKTVSDRGDLPKLLQQIGAVNVVLINAAVSTDRFEWILDKISKAKPQGLPARSSLASDSRLYNIHSFNDSANRYLFRLASVFSPDVAECAAGACGVPAWPTLCVDSSGHVVGAELPAIRRPGSPTEQLVAWNVDVSSMVFDHTDIYKGRVARLVVDLLFRTEPERRAELGRRGSTAVGKRCPDSVADSP